MFIPLHSARLCMDCEAIFEEARCPRCSSESFYPLSRWVRPAIATDTAVTASRAKKASLVLLGSGVALAAWQLLKRNGRKPSEKGEPPQEGPQE